MIIRTVRAELLRSDGQTDVTMLIVALRYFPNTYKDPVRVAFESG